MSYKVNFDKLTIIHKFVKIFHCCHTVAVFILMLFHYPVLFVCRSLALAFKGFLPTNNRHYQIFHKFLDHYWSGWTNVSNTLLLLGLLTFVTDIHYLVIMHV